MTSRTPLLIVDTGTAVDVEFGWTVAVDTGVGSIAGVGDHHVLLQS